MPKNFFDALGEQAQEAGAQIQPFMQLMQKQKAEAADDQFRRDLQIANYETSVDNLHLRQLEASDRAYGQKWREYTWNAEQNKPPTTFDAAVLKSWYEGDSKGAQSLIDIEGQMRKATRDVKIADTGIGRAGKVKSDLGVAAIRMQEARRTFMKDQANPETATAPKGTPFESTEMYKALLPANDTTETMWQGLQEVKRLGEGEADEYALAFGEPAYAKALANIRSRLNPQDNPPPTPEDPIVARDEEIRARGSQMLRSHLNVGAIAKQYFPGEDPAEVAEFLKWYMAQMQQQGR